MSAGDLAHLHAVVRGRVQGVYFRAHASRRAQSLRVTGYVRNLSSGEEVALEAEDAHQAEKTAWEEELLGVSISYDPLGRAARGLKNHVTALVSELDPEMNGQKVILGGMLSEVRPLVTREGKPFGPAASSASQNS